MSVSLCPLLPPQTRLQAGVGYGNTFSCIRMVYEKERVSVLGWVKGPARVPHGLGPRPWGEWRVPARVPHGLGHRPWGGWRVPAMVCHGLGPRPHSYTGTIGMRELVPAYHLFFSLPHGKCYLTSAYPWTPSTLLGRNWFCMSSLEISEDFRTTAWKVPAPTRTTVNFTKQ